MTAVVSMDKSGTPPQKRARGSRSSKSKTNPRCRSKRTRGRNDLAPEIPITLVSIDRMFVAPRDIRKFETKRTAEIARSITEAGRVSVALIRGDGLIIDGHADIAAAIHLGLEDFPCVYVEQLLPAQLRVQVVAPGQSAKWIGKVISARRPTSSTTASSGRE